MSDWPKSFHDGRVVLYEGDCLSVLDGLAENSVDAICTDPPYHLLSIVKRFGGTSRDDDTQTGDRARRGADGMARLSRGFMGKEWDGGDIAFRTETWAKVLRVLKPGGHIVAFSAPKCSHRMVCAIEDAGFEIRDALQWMFGTGFPKSHNLRDEWQGWGTALKPAYEPICLARKPLSEKSVAANVLRWGTGALNIDATRVETGDSLNGVAYSDGNKDASKASSYATGVKAGKFEQPIGRWPANICHDGSDEVVRMFPDTSSGLLQTHHKLNESENRSMSGKNYARSPKQDSFGDSGSAARFFYSAKADATDRAFSRHPTVKPVSLMRWLVRMVTPPGGTVLDPFAGTGTTGHAALLEGFNAILIERETEYLADIERRMALVFAGEIERASHAKQDSPDALPLFGADNAGGARASDLFTGSLQETQRRANRNDEVVTP